ncbi:MAG: hypothetical protein Kow00102_03380 [Spirochaetota bacterium]
MSMHLSADVYDIFEKAFQGKNEAKKVMYAIEEAIVSTVHDTWYKTKEELKLEVLSFYATKDDLLQVRTELLAEMKKDKAEILGIMKQDKAELSGIIEQNKAELLGIMKQDKAELSGKLEALYEKTERDKAELLGIMKQDKAELLGIIEQNKAELLGKFDTLFQKTEKDKAELLGIMKQDKAEFALKIEKLDKKFSMYFAVMMFAIIFLNQNALEFLAKILGLIR